MGADGANKGKLAAIVDVIDQNRALIEGPGIARGAARLSTLHLTKLKVKVNHSAKSSILKKATVRANLTDFEKFKVNKLKAQRRRLVAQQINKKVKQVSQVTSLSFFYFT